MQRNVTYLMSLLLVGLLGLLWIAHPAHATSQKARSALASVSTLSSSQAVNGTQTSTTAKALTTTRTITAMAGLTKTPGVTTTWAVTSAKALTATAVVTTTPTVTETKAITSAKAVTATKVVTSVTAITSKTVVTSVTAVTSTTPTTAAAPAQGACQELVVDGSFENHTGWKIPATQYSASYSTDRAFDGKTSLRLGLPDNSRNIFSFSTGYQWIRLPANAKTITLKALVWRSSSSTTDRDFQYLIVNPMRGPERRVFMSLSNTQHWEPIVYDLTPFKGQPVSIIFGTYNNGHGGKALMYVDSVSVQSCK